MTIVKPILISTCFQQIFDIKKVNSKQTSKLAKKP